MSEKSQSFNSASQKLRHHLTASCGQPSSVNECLNFMSATVLQSAQDEGSGGGQPGAAVVTNIKKEAKTPPLYKVLLHNDDFTPMDFVIMILKRFFSKDENQATQIMLAVHNEGKAVCGVFTFEIAETKVGKVVKMAAEHQYPLKCTLEKE